MTFPKFIRLNGRLYRRAFTVGSPNPKLKGLLASILSEAGISFAENQCFFGPDQAKWSGPRHVALEIRFGGYPTSSAGEENNRPILFFVHGPGNPYFNKVQAKDKTEAARLLKSVKEN